MGSIFSKTPWLDGNFLLKVLEGVDERNKNAEVVSWKCEKAAPPGTSYQSQLFRVRVEYRVDNNDCSTCLIVKSPLCDNLDSIRGTQREVLIYNEVLPKMFQLHSWQGAPKAFPSPLPDTIVMEDLREQGYRIYPRGKLMDFDHCKEILTNLSTFHAMSVGLHHRNPGMIMSFGQDTSSTTDDDDLDKEYWKSHLGKFASLKECAGFAEKIRRSSETISKSVREIFRVSKCLNVLTHGDLWLYNIMFSYNQSGVLLDSKLVDFQGPRYCSFASDLIMLWWSSVDVEVRELHQEELFEVYRHNLNKILEEINCDERVSKEEFDCEVRRFSSYALRPVSIHLEFASKDSYLKMLPTVLRQMDDFGVFS